MIELQSVTAVIKKLSNFKLTGCKTIYNLYSWKVINRILVNYVQRIKMLNKYISFKLDLFVYSPGS